MEEFQRTIRVSDLMPGMLKTVRVDGEDVLLANVDGTYYGIGAICKHQEYDLSEGKLDGKRVTCALHGAVWDLATGEGEFSEPLEDEPTYDIKVEEEYLCVRKRWAQPDDEFRAQNC